MASTPANGDSPLSFRRAWDVFNRRTGRAMETADRRMEKADAAVARAETAAQALRSQAVELREAARVRFAQARVAAAGDIGKLAHAGGWRASQLRRADEWEAKAHGLVDLAVGAQRTAHREAERACDEAITAAEQRYEVATGESVYRYREGGVHGIPRGGGRS